MVATKIFSTAPPSFRRQKVSEGRPVGGGVIKTLKRKCASLEAAMSELHVSKRTKRSKVVQPPDLAVDESEQTSQSSGDSSHHNGDVLADYEGQRVSEPLSATAGQHEGKSASMFLRKAEMSTKVEAVKEKMKCAKRRLIKKVDQEGLIFETAKSKHDMEHRIAQLMEENRELRSSAGVVREQSSTNDPAGEQLRELSAELKASKRAVAQLLAETDALKAVVCHFKAQKESADDLVSKMAKESRKKMQYLESSQIALKERAVEQKRYITKLSREKLEVSQELSRTKQELHALQVARLAQINGTDPSTPLQCEKPCQNNTRAKDDNEAKRNHDTAPCNGDYGPKKMRRQESSSTVGPRKSTAQTHYSILQIDPTASFSDIKKAYRILALKHHPDKNKKDPNSANTFREIKRAYEVLSNDELRREYDSVTYL